MRQREKEKERLKAKKIHKRQRAHKDVDPKPASSDGTPHFEGELPEEFIANQEQEVRQFCCMFC